MTAATELALDAAREEIERLGQSLVKAQELRDAISTVRADVVAMGIDLDGMTIGEASPGHYYVMLLVPVDAELKIEPRTQAAPLGALFVEVTP